MLRLHRLSSQGVRSRQSRGKSPSGAAKERPPRVGKAGWDCGFYGLNGDNDKNFHVCEK